MDPSTLSNISSFTTKHSLIKLEVDFKSKTLHGSVTKTLQLHKEEPLILDCVNINIKNVSLIQNSNQLVWKNESQKLEIVLPKGLKIFQVRIDFSTTEKCSAIQWLDPAQTHGKKHPYLFSQCQAIHGKATFARTLLPCQDSPAIKATYDAEITVPSELTALMSAIRCGETTSPDGQWKTFKFEQKVPIPSYLIAIAVGHLTGIEIGKRSTVWSEPGMTELGAQEFTDTETFIKVAEELITPYSWGRYDLLLLPPSFPYGGMENPCLTFVTPTLLAGDKSLVDVIAHEISHSWSGNLVTNKSWEHFWLNEGFCMFIERKILGRIHGHLTSEFSSIIGWKALKESIILFGETNPLTCLQVNLSNTDPDDAFSSVPYEKGYNFLYHLEKVVGGPSYFEPYLREHYKHFIYQSITTADWKNFLYSYFTKNHPEVIAKLDAVDWDTWLLKPGMPPIEMPFDMTLSNECVSLAKKWDNSRNGHVDFEVAAFHKFTTGQKIVFLETLSDCDPLPHNLLDALDASYKLTQYSNSEIRFRWQILAIKGEYEQIYPEVVKFVLEQGRMKYVRPLYRALSKTKNGAELGKKTFIENRSFYHPIAANLIAKDILNAK